MSIKDWVKKLVSVPVPPANVEMVAPVVPPTSVPTPTKKRRAKSHTEQTSTEPSLPKKKKESKSYDPPTVESTLPEITIYPPMPAEKKTRKPRKAKVAEPVAPVRSGNPEKDAATAAGEPWVSVIGIDLDLDNLSSGSFNLDWNEIFVAKLIRAGYKGKSDIDLVDMWFTDICRNVLAENYEQMIADPTNRTTS